jgi:hypothetical protein
MANSIYGTKTNGEQIFDPLAGADWSMHLIDPAKKNADWGYQVITYLYGNMSFYYTYRGYNAWDGTGGMAMIKDYSNGCQSPDITKQLFDAQFKGERTGTNPNMVAQYTNLNWEIISVIPKYRRILEARLNKIETNIECTATDVLAKNAKQEAKLQLSIQKYVDEIMADFSKRMKLDKPMKSGIGQATMKSPTSGDAMSALNDIEFDLSNDAELQFYMDNYFKLKVEIASEITLQAILDLNEIDRIKKQLDRDAIDYAFCATRVFRDKNTMFPKIERLDISKIMMPYSTRNDKKDIGGWGYYEYCSLNRVIELLGDEMTPEMLRELYKFACTYPTGFAVGANMPDITQTRVGFFDFEKVKLPMVYVEFLSQNAESYEYTKTKFNSTKLKKVDFGYETKDKNKSVKQHWAQVAYCGYYIPQYPKLLGFKKLENQIRDEGNPQLCKFTASFWEFEPKSIMEQLIPMANEIQLASLKIQHALVKALPSGYSFDVSALNRVILGDGGTNTPQELLKMYLQTGSTLHASEDEAGNMKMSNSNAPHQRLLGGLLEAEVAGYWGEIDRNINLMEKLIGYSPAVAGDSGDPRVSAKATALAAAAADNATYFLTEGIKNILEDTAVITNMHIQELIKEGGKAEESLEAMIGELNEDVIESLSLLPLHHFGIFFKEKMSDEKKQLFMATVAQAYAKGEVDLSDMLAIEFFDNYKQAVALLNIRMKKKRAEMQQAAQAQMEQQTQITQSLEQLKLMIANGQMQAQVQGKQITANAELQKTQMKEQGANQREIAKHLGKKDQIQHQGNIDARNSVLENNLQSQSL